MVVRIPKRRKWRRGHRTYHGSHKKWRGKGSRGGRGKAGMHKHKWTYTVKYEPEHFGKKGFKSVKKKRKLKEKTINLSELRILVEKLESEKKIKFEDGKLKINLEEFGYDKILGKGKLDRALIVEVKKVSNLAKRKIEEKGGKIILVK